LNQLRTRTNSGRRNRSVLQHINLVNSNLKCLFSPSIEALDIVIDNTKKKTLKKSSSTAIVQNWTPRCRRTQEVSDFLETSSGQPSIDLTWNQLRINLAFCVQSFGLWSLSEEEKVKQTRTFSIPSSAQNVSV
jgi:hypothetical protein